MSSLFRLSLVVLALALYALGQPYLPSYLTGNPFWGLFNVVVAGCSVYTILKVL